MGPGRVSSPTRQAPFCGAVFEELRDARPHLRGASPYGHAPGRPPCRYLVASAQRLRHLLTYAFAVQARLELASALHSRSPTRPVPGLLTGEVDDLSALANFRPRDPRRGGQDTALSQLSDCV